MPTIGPDRACAEEGGGWDGRPLETANLRLRAPVEADLAGIVRLADDERVARTTAELPHPYTEDDGRAFLAAAAEPMAGGRLTFAVERRAEAGPIGCAGLIDRGDAAEIGYWIGHPFWGRGYATEVVHALLRLIFGRFDFERAEAEVMVANPASERVLAKAGFKVMREEEGCRGRCTGQPVRIYGLERAAWRAREEGKPTLLVAAAALIDTDGRVLVARRPEGKSMAGLWEFPGGKVDAGETPEYALVRELREELGIDATASCLAPIAFASHGYDDFHLLMPLFACRVWRGDVVAREGQTLRWVRANRIADLPMPPADAPLVALLRDLL